MKFLQCMLKLLEIVLGILKYVKIVLDNPKNCFVICYYVKFHFELFLDDDICTKIV